MQWAVILAAAARLVGLINLAAVHWQKVSLSEDGSIYSGVLLLAFMVTFPGIILLGVLGMWAIGSENMAALAAEVAQLRAVVERQTQVIEGLTRAIESLQTR